MCRDCAAGDLLKYRWRKRMHKLSTRYCHGHDKDDTVHSLSFRGMKHPRLDQRSALSAQKGHIQARTGRHVCYATWESSKTLQRSQHARIALMEALRQEWAARLANNVRLDRIASLINRACASCTPGSYQDKAGQDSCSICSSWGRTHSMRGAVICQQCAPGTRGNSSRQGCIDCEPGTSSALFAVTECTPCPLGTHQTVGGSAGLQSLPDHTRYVHATCGLEQKVHHLPPWRQLHISAVLWRQEGMVVVSIADHHGRRRDPLARWNRPSSNILVSHERSHQILQAAWARQ